LLGKQYKLKAPKYDVDEAKRRDATYASQMYVPTRLINKETGEIKEQEVFIGDLPLMTERGTFIINGAERVIVNQIVRSPGVYYKDEHRQKRSPTYNANLIPNRGAWLKFETDKNDLAGCASTKPASCRPRVAEGAGPVATTRSSTPCATPSISRKRSRRPKTRAVQRRRGPAGAVPQAASR
jgi:DNA-directed RNA polymerase beta subunit